MADQQTVLAALQSVRDPELHRDIVSLNMVRDLEVEGSRVAFNLVLTTPACPLRETIDRDVRAALAVLPDITEVDIHWDAEVRGGPMREGGPKPVEGVKNVIAVGSNKGGVGKSTVSVNLAVALAQLGARVGLLDADITGPNIPTMMGIEAGGLAEGTGGLHTIEAHGVRCISIGFVLPPGTPVVWRGPMIGSGVRQLLHDVDWGELDYLIVDLPPGTSDASMSLAQEAEIAGVVIVSMPQKVSVEDATKAVGMFDRMGVPIFGIV
ncbi:MAG: Mrp/NBP35 family ATP-binding protein, partial [Dehalococcoidia bacterium]|nr:Mrp/NBP35 family ATP-binding protein [Dehalococcoidia bacterium]